VLGAVVGNQVGGGNGKTAMTVLGAVGGGFAGHEVEKRVRSTTAYDVRVRMEDGSRRTVQREQAPAVGTRVVLDGDASS
jgi:outer membrane lipoprotein SlyB